MLPFSSGCLSSGITYMQFCKGRVSCLLRCHVQCFHCETKAFTKEDRQFQLCPPAPETVHEMDPLDSGWEESFRVLPFILRS